MKKIKSLFKSKDPELEGDLKKLEVHLRSALQPVSIRPEFVKDLQARLFSGAIPTIQQRLPSTFSQALLIAGGIFGGLMVIIAGIRGMISLIFVLVQLVQRLKLNTQRRQPTPA